MDGTTDLRDDEVEEAVAVSFRFAKALFDDSDRIIIRPIETWIETGQKRSDVDYKRTSHVFPVSESWCVRLAHLIRASYQDRLNLFFGVCPRFRPGGGFDLAWQIRTVQCLWADVDNVALEPTYERIEKAGLPPPSVVVNSGNGFHLYWRLDTPYLIDDVGDPPHVQTEWTEPRPGRKKPRRYIVENGDRVYLDQRRHLSRLSPKAEHVQDIVAGLAKLIGGDHTHDISRLLRIPGTLNRKDQRNGQPPTPTQLVECEPSRRYPLSLFEAFKSASPQSDRAKQVAAMPLPVPRSITPNKADGLADHIAACIIAPAGSRSEADFALCCYAIRNGIAQADVWTQVEAVGKFAEQGSRYFDVTWENAEFEVRAAKLDQMQKRPAARRPAKVLPVADSGDRDGGQPPDDLEVNDDGTSDGESTIYVDPETMEVKHTLHRITDQLLLTGNCFLRSGQLVVVHEEQIDTILTAPEMAGLLNEYVEFYFVDDEAGQYKPLPPVYATTWLNKRSERCRLPTISLFTRNPVYSDDWRLIAPGFDVTSGIFYAGPGIGPRAGTEHLDRLLRDFCFKTPGDRTNYLGILLTAMLVPRFIGSKPAALLNGNQPELGKTILGQIIAILRDGQAAETLSYNPDDEEFEKRLGAIVRRGATTIIVDNAKAQGRNPRIESACLERSITDPILSFRLLGQSASIRAENSHLFVLTANAPEVSRDLVTRSVVINLHYEGDPERREFSIVDPEGYAQDHRIALLGELIGMVERWKASGMPMAKVHSRFNKRGWGNIVGGILEACGEPDFLANAQEAATQLDETRREFAELVITLANHPQGNWSASELVELCSNHKLLAADLGEGSPRSLATRMGALAGRFVNERFPLTDDREVVFHRSKERNGSVYRVAIHENLRNL